MLSGKADVLCEWAVYTETLGPGFLPRLELTSSTDLHQQKREDSASRSLLCCQLSKLTDHQCQDEALMTYPSKVS